MTTAYFARAFGLVWASDHPLHLFAAASDPVGPADVMVERVGMLPPRAGGMRVNNGELFADGVRFGFGNAVFDMFDGRLVRWSAPGGAGLPLALFGTVTGLLLAWRGLAPLHGSAASIDGRTVLIAGRSGAGKSTLCHALVERGGLLVSDDLSALLPMTADGVPMLQPGRPAIRLVDRAGRADRDDKLLVSPAAVDQARPVRLDALILLQDAPLSPGPAAAAQALARQLFRPGWMRRLPRRAERTATIFLAAQRIAVHVLPPAPSAPDLTPHDKANALLALLR